MKNNVDSLSKGSIALTLLCLLGSVGKSKIVNEKTLFPKGNLVPTENFTGNAWNLGLVANDSTYNTIVGNVYFEAGARTNWHSHPSGQILVIIDGEGFHQIKGGPKQFLKKGDVVKCPPYAMHWHGASPNKSMSQMYIVPNTENGIVNWMEPVTNEVYAASSNN